MNTILILHLVFLTWSVVCGATAIDRLRMVIGNPFHQVLNIVMFVGCCIAWAVGLGLALYYGVRMGGK